MSPSDLVDDLRSRINPAYVQMLGTESWERQQCVEALEAQAAEIERLNQCLQYEQHRAERIGTHGPGCETWGPQHYECAVRQLGQLRKFAGTIASVMGDASCDISEIDEAMAELESAAPASSATELDAARYRWLREQHEGANGSEPSAIAFTVFGPGDHFGLEPVGCLPGELDAEIDAARGGSDA